MIMESLILEKRLISTTEYYVQTYKQARAIATQRCIFCHAAKPLAQSARDGVSVPE
jgi:uncharacterized membrane protein